MDICCSLFALPSQLVYLISIEEYLRGSMPIEKDMIIRALPKSYHADRVNQDNLSVRVSRILSLT